MREIVLSLLTTSFALDWQFTVFAHTLRTEIALTAETMGLFTVQVTATTVTKYQAMD